MTIEMTEYKFKITMQSPAMEPEVVREAVEKALSYISGSVEVKPLEQPVKAPELYEHEFIVKIKSASNNHDLAFCELDDAIKKVLPLNRYCVFHNFYSIREKELLC